MSITRVLSFPFLIIGSPSVITFACLILWYADRITTKELAFIVLTFPIAVLGILTFPIFLLGLRIFGNMETTKYYK
jgi:hypothetical protein